MAIADIHEDIIKTNILTRLDGQSLAAAGCASSELQSLCSDDKLWSDVCSSNWPSTNDPLVTNIISNFPSSYRSFYSDVFSSPDNCHLSVTSVSPATQIISSVDLKYNDKLIFSKVESTNTTPSDWFQTSPFRIDLLEPKELISSSTKLSNDHDILFSNLENHMTLSWIMIDPTQNRAVNLSSVKPVSVQRNWLTTDIELTFAIVMKHDDNDNEYINCNILVTCGVKQGGEEVNVSGVSLTIVDMDGKCLNGKDSMVILQGLNAAKRQCNNGERRKEMYDEYIQRKRERTENTVRRERRLDMACVASGVALVMAFWSFAIC